MLMGWHITYQYIKSEGGQECRGIHLDTVLTFQRKPVVMEQDISDVPHKAFQ